MPVAATVASRMAEALCTRELPLSMELAAELERLLECHEQQDVAAILHAEVIGALRRLHVRFSAIAESREQKLERLQAEFKRRRDFEKTLEALGCGPGRVEYGDVIREIHALFPAEWVGDDAHVG